MRDLLLAVAACIAAALVAPALSLASIPAPSVEYKFEEGAGTTTANTGFYPDATGAISTGATFSTDTPAGTGSNFSLFLDGGPNAYVVIPDSFDYTTDGNPASPRLSRLTIEAWVKPADASALSGQHVVWDDYGNPGVLFGVWDSQVQFAISTDGNPGLGVQSAFAGPALVPGVWQHVAGVYDGTKLVVYVNGQDTCYHPAASGPIINQSPGSPPYIGHAPFDSGLPQHGNVDDLKIYPVALSHDQLADGYFAGKPSSPCPGTVPTQVGLSPSDSVGAVGTSNTVTATATDASGALFSGTTVLFAVSGAVQTSGSCTTASNGQCSFTYSGPALPGADLITACADVNGNGIADPGEPCGTATRAWTLPSSTPGQVTGGGQIPTTGGNDKMAFGFTSKSDSTGAKGECTVVDPATNIKLKCTDVTTLVESAPNATFFGDATVNGAPTTYRIDVSDTHEPGVGYDTFKIQTASGYAASGVLTGGNIQVH